MSEIVIRNALRDEAATIAPLIRLMVTDMAGYGGHRPAAEFDLCAASLSIRKTSVIDLHPSASRLDPNTQSDG
jgi:hypothetical protein